MLINDALGLSNGMANRLLWVSMSFGPDKVFGANLAINVPFDISFGGPPIGALAGSRNDGTALVFDCSIPACGFGISAAGELILDELEYHIDALQVVEHETGGE